MKKHKKDQWNWTWLKSSAVRRIWKILSSNGAKVYFVGGCVRDTILGREIKDIDIATDALPSKVVELAQAAGLKVIKVGLKYGSVKVVVEQECFEVTTFRSDLVTDGRHPKVGFSQNILDDASRRDFTMNAIYMTIDGKIIDPLSGWEDLINGHVRFIGEPKKRIKEDYLRILRYFRFISTYVGSVESVDYNSVKACTEAIPGLKTLSHNRVWEELQKILLAEDPYPVLQLMKGSNILDEILPLANVGCLARFLKIENKVDLESTEINRLLALNINCARSWVKNFPLKKEKIEWLKKILVILRDHSSLKVKGYKYGMNLTLASLALSKANSSEKIENNDLANIKQGSVKKFPINASDLLEFFPPSRDLGVELKRLQCLWFASDLELGRNELLVKLKKQLHSK
tara:strand:+ start:575 stop:1780 length:1206 start_codon:yes stop_codon:yes gene_type:complete